MSGSSSAARPWVTPAEGVLTHVQDTGGHAHRQQEEASSNTDQNMGQASKLPDRLPRPPGPVKPGPARDPSCSRSSAPHIREPLSSFIAALESSFLKGCLKRETKMAA